MKNNQLEQTMLASLRSSNPCPANDLDSADSESAKAMLTSIFTGSERLSPALARHRWRFGGPRFAALTSLAVVASVGVFFAMSRGGQPAVAATPRPLTFEVSATRNGAVKELENLADLTAKLPNDVGTGRAVAITYKTWSLFTRIDGADTSSKLVEQRVSKLVGASGLRSISVRYSVEGRDINDRSSSAGDPVVQLTGDYQQLTQELGEDQSSDAARRFNAVTELLLETPTEPAVRAGLLRYIAETEGVSRLGAVRDRLGRGGLGFSVSSTDSGLPTTYTLIVDPTSGAFLGYEEMLTDDAGKLGVPIPSVIQYITWESSQFQQ